MEWQESSQIIFLVDDDPDDHYVFTTALREVDPLVMLKTFASCEELLNNLNESGQLPSLIIIDMNMPAMDGCQCLTEVRRLEAFSSVPVIMYSTASSPSSINATYQAGARGFFVKPNSMAEIKVVIRQLLGDWVYRGTTEANSDRQEAMSPNEET